MKEETSKVVTKVALPKPSTRNSLLVSNALNAANKLKLKEKALAENEEEDEAKVVERIKRDFEWFVDKKYGSDLADVKALMKEALGKAAAQTMAHLDPDNIKLTHD